MKIRNESINKNYLTPSIIFTLGIATVFGVGIYNATNIANTSNANALSYSTSKDISFTFAPTLSIGLSTNNLTIDNLVPGTTSDSNKVSVTVSSNTQYGYILSAGIGSTVSTDPYYNTSDLVHDNSTTQVPTTNKFSSIATSASLPTLDTDNTWGYSTSTDSGTNWSTYSGLSYAETKPLLDISDPATPSTIDFKIAARSASTQASGTYNNVITFYAVGKPEPPQYLYDEVAKMSKGTQSATDLQAGITSPTSRDYREDTSNSGVYEYDSAIFGESSDASNANKIYYYRGVLETAEDQGEYGSDGQATTYPNYVKLDNNTCWRVVRTTGSGGVKMIYNGLWTGNTCANVKNAAQIGSGAFNYGYNQAVKIGYTYNSDYASNTSEARTLAELYGTNSNDRNTSNSTIKNRVETWFDDTIVAYSDILEASAGYCGDRTVYRYKNQVQPELESFTTPQYATSMTGLFYGSYNRNLYGTSPTLTCARPKNGVVDRSTVDLYSMDGSVGNGKLSRPIALLTADEINLSGQGKNGSYLNYLNSGNAFWLLSPHSRDEYGQSNVIIAGSKASLSGDGTRWEEGIRPAISLAPFIEYESGSGIATDPWVVPAP